MKVERSSSQAQASETKESKEVKGPEADTKADAPDQKPDQAKDSFEDPKPKPMSMREEVAACDAQSAGKPPPEGKYGRADAEALLDETPAGKEVLADLKALEAKGPITIQDHEFCGAAAGAWDAKSRTIDVDPDSYLTREGYTQTVVHELTHASQDAGLNPERDGVTRPMSDFNSADQWANHEIDKEMRAEARAFDVMRERGFDKSSSAILRAKYDEVLNGGGTRDQAIAEMAKLVNEGKADPQWAGERAQYVTDWNNAHPNTAAAVAGAE